MDINNLAKGTKPQSGFSQHPNGFFAGTVESIKAGATTNTNIPYWDLQIRTNHGVVFYKIWGFSADDIERASTEQNHNDMVRGSIARTKGIFIDLGVWSDPVAAEEYNWAGPSPSVMNDMQFLIGCDCTVNVQASKKEAGRQVVYINPRSDAEDKVTGTVKAENSAAPGAQFPPANTSTPGQVAIDDVPF